MKVNPILRVTLFFISVTMLISAHQQQADAANDFIFQENTIRVDIDGFSLAGGKYGILDLVEVGSAGDLALIPGIQELSITDADGQQVLWEEGQSILAQALGIPFSAVPASDMKRFQLRREDGGTFDFFSAFDLSDKLDKIKSRTTRAHFYRDAVLRAVVLEETGRLYPDLLPDATDNSLDDSLQLLGLANIGAKVGGSAYQHLRQVEDYRKALEHGQIVSKNELAKKVAHRIHKGPFGKSVRALGVLSAVLELADNINDEIRRNSLMAEMAKDIIILKGLEDTLLLMEQDRGPKDPAMIDGMKMALDDLAVVSKDRLKAVATGIGKTTPTLIRVLAPQVLKLSGKALKAAPKVGKFVKIGSSGLLVALEAAELVNALNEFEKAAFTVSALTTMGNYLERWIPFISSSAWLRPAGFPIRELIGFYERVVSEEAAGLYNMAWTDRWGITSIADLGRGIGTQWAEWKAQLKGKAWDKEGYEEWSEQTAMKIRRMRGLYTAMPIFLNELKQVYVPRPTSEPEPTPESTSLADIALIIDSSGSMGGSGGSDPNNLRISGAKLFIESAEPKVQIAIVDFDGDAETFAPLTFADDIGKNRLKNAVDRVDAGGGTNIDAGLQQGFQELNASASSAKKAAVLLTDGQDSVAQQITSNYAAQGWPIYTIGLGSGVKRQELERIARATGGEYFEASHDYHIQTVYSVILAKTTGQSTLASYAGYINKGQQITRKVLIDNTVDQANISCNWQGSTIELVLIDPDGTQITPRDAAANPRITYKPAATYAIYTLENPKVGNWQIQATGTDIPPQGEPFNLTVSATSDFFTSLLSFDSSYTVGETIQIGIEVKEKTGDTSAAVLGATTSAKVVRPDGRIDTLNLYDDGSHNDRAANDGVYANNYRSVDKRGTYLIKVSAENGFSREIQEQVVVGNIDNVFIDGSTLTPAAGAALKQAPSVISAVISGPAGRINHNSIALKVDGRTVSHTYNRVNQLVSYRSGGLSGGSHDVQLSLRDTSGNAIETTWQFTIGSSVVTTAHPYIYWTNHGTKKIQRSNLDGTDVEDLVTTGLSWPLGIALDVSGGKVYWANSWRGRIQRSNLDGTSVENLVTGLPRPAGIALDVSGGKMYWAEEGGRIRRSNLDGMDVEDLVTGLGTSYGIALDVIGGKIYWTSSTRRKIQRSNLDGTDVEDLVTGLPGPHHIALDVSGGKMYWADIQANKIQRSNLNGTGVEDLVTTGLDGPDGIALDVSNGKIYWSDWGTDKIQRSNLDGTGVEDLVTEIGGAGDIALGISSQMPPPVAQEDIAHIYWTEGGGAKIQRANLDGSQVQDLLTRNDGLRHPHSIALDMAGGKMYWADANAVKIQRANLDGSNIEDLVTRNDGLHHPVGITLDIVGGKMYWADERAVKIQRANLDGSNIEDLVTGHGKPDAIALDVAAGKMYWTGWGTDEIQRANLDGSNVQNIATVDSPDGIALDVAAGKIYWTDTSSGKIQRANLDGSNIEDLVTTGLNHPGGIALDVAAGKMYWANVIKNKIQRANLDGSNIEDLVTTGLVGPVGISLAISSQFPPVVRGDVDQSRVLFADDFSSGNLDKWTPRARIGTVENGALKLVGIQGGNYSVDVIKDIFPTENYARYVLSFDWKSTVKETPYGISHVSAYFYDRTGKLIGQMLALNTGFPNRTFEDHGGDLVPGRYGGVFKVHESFDWERVTLDTTIAVPRLNIADVHRIHLRAEVYNDAGSGGDLYVDNFSFAGVSGTSRVVPEDVNRDGVVDLQDTSVVRANLGQRGQNDADVNGDGIVDVDDLVLVLAAIEAAAGGAPSFQTQVLLLFTAEEVQEWLAEARLSGDTSPAYLRGIAVLEQILALLTPQETLLLANYPNPFNPETWIPYRLAKAAEVTLTIYAVNGQVVRTLALGHQAAGFYESRSRAAYWDGRNAQGESVASGVYFYTLSAGDFTATRKLLIRK